MDRSMSDWTKNQKNINNKLLGMGDAENITKSEGRVEAGAEIISINSNKKFLNGLFGDITNKSAYNQILIGAVSGWCTGFATMKVGKLTAIVIGSTIIIVEIAHQEGLIEINWGKLMGTLETTAEQVERDSAGLKKGWTDYDVDRKFQRSEWKLKRWYKKLLGIEDDRRLNEYRSFLTAFIGGVTLGIICA